ncbi:hypothetical protein CAMRE0001_3204 [Campylobacter rectus RM3267]|uniref:Uncharacterized protein n=1 Tax=Campylobacter rectus RM3267 TaxID=553218 RepID=B9D1B7_CAMRE|nr:hypothetical protein CAMRE0001_3204 [Campylobacter rectus RM3267]
MPGGLYGYLYGVNLLNSASAQANSVVRLKASACAFFARGRIYALARVLPSSNLRGVNFYEFTKTLEKI